MVLDSAMARRHITVGKTFVNRRNIFMVRNNRYCGDGIYYLSTHFRFVV